MIVAKGKTLPDGTYVWTCNKCDGTGLVGIRPCDWCYGLDTPRILEAMSKGARGQRYYALLKAFLSVQGKAMVDYAKSLDRLTPVAVGHISLKFGLNFKATCEWLEETNTIRRGVYNMIADSNYKVADIYAAARRDYGMEQGVSE